MHNLPIFLWLLLSICGPVLSQEYCPITPSLWNKLEDNSSSIPFYIGTVGEELTLDIGIQVYTSKKWDIRPSEYHWGYDDPSSSFVQLPLSSSLKLNGTEAGWTVIRSELSKLANSSKTGEDFASAIRNYNPSIAEECNFGILEEPEVALGLKEFLPTIIYHALELPIRLARPIPVLKRKGSNHTIDTIYLNRKLAASLLAHCFLGTFPHSSNRTSNHLPQFHFMPIFHQEDGESGKEAKVEKIKHLIEYFYVIGNGSGLDNSVISYKRRHDGQPAKDDNIDGNEEGSILRLHFPNKYVGGDVLRDGVSIDEIRTLLRPELLVSLLFTERLGKDDVLEVTGVRQVSDYSGTGSNYRFQKLDKDPAPSVPIDELGRETTRVIVTSDKKSDR